MAREKTRKKIKKTIKCYLVVRKGRKPFDNNEGDVPVYFDRQSAWSNSLDESLKICVARLTW